MNRDTKPYDTAFKDLAEREPELLLRLIGALPPGATVKVLSREISAPMLAADQPYEVTSATEHFIAHVEAQLGWVADVPERVTHYQAILWVNYKKPVHTYVLLLTARGLPMEAPAVCTINAGDLTLQSRLTMVKCWELSAVKALATGSPNLLPFIPLMDGGQAELEEAARALGQVADEPRKLNLAAHFVVNGGLRYNRPDILELIERLAMIPIQTLRESSVYQFIVEEGERKRLTNILQRLARQRFPGVELTAEIDRVPDLAALEDLCVNLSTLPDEATLHARLKTLAVNGQHNGTT